MFSKCSKFFMCLTLFFPVFIYSQWQTYYTQTATSYNDVSVASTNVIWAVGFHPGTVIRTTNGGTNWILSDNGLDDTIGIETCFALDANTAWVAGGYGTQRIFKTTNGGLNWLELSYPRQDVINKIRFFNANTGVMFVDHNFPPSSDTCNYLVTRDGGNSWYRPPHAPVILLFDDIYVLDSSFVVFLAAPASGTQRKLYRLQGGLDSQWESFDLPTAFDLTVFKDHFNGIASNGYAAQVYRTSNGGANWSSSPANVLTTFQGIWVPGTDWVMLYGCCYQYLTRNFGTTYDSLRGRSFVRGNAKDTNSIWMAGDGGKLYKYNPAYIGIQQISNEVPREFVLHQNYPNPFNPETRITFELPKAGPILFEVFDAAGKQVYVLSDEVKNPGKYGLGFNGSNLASGVYYYRITANDPSTGSGHSYVQSKKMILLK